MKTKQQIDKIINDFDNIIEQFNDIRRLAIPIADAIFKKKGYKTCGIDIDEISVCEDGQIYVETQHWDRYGDLENIDISFPTDYLVDEGFVERIELEIKQEAERKKQEELEAKEERRLKRLAAKEAKDIADYAKLKAKFEGDKS